MKPHYKLISIFILIGIVFACIFVKCEPSETVDATTWPETEILKSVISDLNHENDSLKVKANLKDTVWMKGAIRWRDAKGKYKADSIPCDSLIVICDTLLYQDSSYISTLKTIIKVDSNIIANYEKIVRNDSIYIEALKKQVKKERRKKWVFGGAGLLTGIIAGKVL